MNSDIHVTIVIHGKSRYVFMYRRGQLAEVFRAMNTYASNPELDFTWRDCHAATMEIWKQFRADAVHIRIAT